MSFFNPESKTQNPESRGAFSLVELLIVIVIIGVLAGLLVPAFNRVRAGARSAECKNNLRQVYTALEIYRGKGEGYYPFAALLPSVEEEGRPRLRDVLEGDAGSPRVFKCPADGKGCFEAEGSSYEYNVRLAGQRVLQGRFQELMGTTRIPVFYDYEEFHASRGATGARNFVYLDGHVGISRALPASDDNAP